MAQIDGPSHYYVNSDRENASTQLNSFLIKKQNYNLLRLNYLDIDNKNLRELTEYILKNIQIFSTTQENIDASSSANKEIKPESPSTTRKYESINKNDESHHSWSKRIRKEKEILEKGYGIG
ncbi:hypothetical protein NOVO_03015 [Rickettsiales bacterium Ac37b]|nr:hypothetical protein NOVO_03015 [Rickettsiales bacterium Ac37b]